LPKVSIVTPSFNQAAFLPATIESVLRQDYPNIEYIIIDGGSIDASVDNIRKHESNLAYWTSEPDDGQSQAINKGFAHATGSIFAWVNSDDLLAPSAITVAVSYLRENSAAGVVYGDRLTIDSRGNVIGVTRCPSHRRGMFEQNITLPQEATFFRRETFEKAGGLDEDLHFAMDFDLWCKMSTITEMRHVPAFLDYFRSHRDAKSVLFHEPSEAQSRSFQEEREAVYRRHFGKGLPPPWKSKFARVARRCRLEYERCCESYRSEVRTVRTIIQRQEV
jgi:glycosyltransferase involved in cell wall biosynthesis